MGPEDFLPMARRIARVRLNGAFGFGFSNEDLVQDGMLALVRRWPEYDPERSPLAVFAFIVLYRGMQDALRAYRPGTRQYPAEVGSWEIPRGSRQEPLWAALPDGASAVEDRVVMVVDVAAAIRVLSDRDRDVLRLRFVEDRTWDEIGELFGVTGSRMNQVGQAAVGVVRSRAA